MADTLRVYLLLHERPYDGPLKLDRTRPRLSRAVSQLRRALRPQRFALLEQPCVGLSLLCNSVLREVCVCLCISICWTRSTAPPLSGRPKGLCTAHARSSRAVCQLFSALVPTEVCEEHRQPGPGSGLLVVLNEKQQHSREVAHRKHDAVIWSHRRMDAQEQILLRSAAGHEPARQPHPRCSLDAHGRQLRRSHLHKAGVWVDV